jgi:uncharacterized membrane protein YfcA
LLLVIAIWLLLPRPSGIVTSAPPRRYLRRSLTDAQGDTFVYSFDPYLGVALGVAIGFISSLFGVGGGIIYVPVMVLLMRFPGYIATATSTFTLVFTSAAGVSVHLTQGSYSGVLPEAASLALGVLIGAQIGALISVRLAHRQALVRRLLSVALIVVSLRLLAGSLL